MIYDFAASSVWLFGAVLLVAALLRWFRDLRRGELTNSLYALQAIVIVLVPLLGPIAYFLSLRGPGAYPRPSLTPAPSADTRTTTS